MFQRTDAKMSSCPEVPGSSPCPPTGLFAGTCACYNRGNTWFARRSKHLAPRLSEQLPDFGLGAVQVRPMTFRQSMPLLFSTALLLGGHGRRSESPPTAGANAEFLSVFCQTRWIEGRIAGCPPPQNCVQSMARLDRRAGDGCDSTPRQRAAFARQLSRFQHADSLERSKLPTAKLLHVRALLSVAASPGSRLLEDGLSSLLHATQLAPEDPALLSDLAALYALDAQRNSRPLSLILGLEAALRATALPAAPPEAFYNSALLLEKLFCIEAAEEAWAEVLRRESQPFWLEEAQARLDALRLERQQSPPDAAKLLAIRDRVWRELLPALESSGANEARATLEILEAHAAILGERSKDPLLEEAVSKLKSVFLSGDHDRWRDLTRGHALFERGYEAYQRGELSPAIVDLATAARLLERRDSPFHFWPRFYIACALQQQERYHASLDALRQLHRSIADQPYRSLLGYVAWMEGQNRVLLGRPLEALDHFRESLAAFGRSGEQDNQAAVHALVADCLLELGRQDEAWQELYQGLRLGQSLAQPRRAVLLFNIAANANLQYRRPRVARLFQDRAFAASAALGNPKISYLSLVDRGLAAAAAADLKAARDDLHAARTLTATISDDSSRRRAKADIAILEAVADPDSGSAAKIARLSEALAVYQNLHYQTAVTITAYEERSRLLAAEGNLESAATDLVAALQLYEQRLLDHSNDQTRWSLHSDAQRTYDRLIALYLEMGEQGKAFSTAERSRQFSLYSEDFRFLLRRSAGRDLTIEEVQHRLGARKVLVLFKQLDSEVLIWIIRQGRTRFLRRPCDAGDLRRAIDDFVRRLRAGSQEEVIRAGSKVLFDSLFADVLQETSPQDLLVLVPDREIFNLPTAAVFTSDGAPLGKRRTLIVTPSVEVYLRAGRKGSTAKPPSGALRALVLSNPSFDSGVWSSLPRLPWAEAEGAAVSSLYPAKVQFVGKAATRSVLLREAPHADIIHFAGHAIVNPLRPDLSLLLLAPEPPERDGALYQHEIYDLELRRSPVVILGACDTSSLSGNPGEGLSSLAHAFLSAGASAVVGTLWPVEDETAAWLVLHLHKGLQRGLSPEQALRQAQTQYLEDEQRRQRDPWGWAAFQVIGASHSPKEAPDA